MFSLERNGVRVQRLMQKQCDIMELMDTLFCLAGRNDAYPWFIFISRKTELDKGTYQLDLFSPWRISKNGKVVVTSEDMFQYSNGESFRDWDETERNRYDDKIEAFLKKRKYVVKNVQVSELYDLRIELSDNVILEVKVMDRYQINWSVTNIDLDDGICYEINRCKRLS